MLPVNNNDNRKTDMNAKKVVITMDGGLIQDVELPPGVMVTVMDFDIEGSTEEKLEKAADGHEFIRSEWRTRDRCPAIDALQRIVSSYDAPHLFNRMRAIEDARAVLAAIKVDGNAKVSVS